MTVPARPTPLFADIADVSRRLAETGYLPDTATATAVFLADRLGKPLLVEGPAGRQDRAGARRGAGHWIRSGPAAVLRGRRRGSRPV